MIGLKRKVTAIIATACICLSSVICYAGAASIINSNLNLELPSIRKIDTLDTIMNQYSNFDSNGDGIHEIEYLKTLSFKSNYTSIGTNDRVALILVEPRLFNTLNNSQYSENDLLNRLERYKNDLEAEGYHTRFIEAKVYSGRRHQDGRTALAIREFFKSVKSSYKNFEGAIFIGSFPETMLVRSWEWKLEVEDGGKTIGGINYPKGTKYLRIVPEIVSHRSDLVIADLDGNWQNIYHEGPENIRSIEAVPADSMGTNWPLNNQVFNCKSVNNNNISFQDFFFIKDDNYTILNSNPSSFSMRIYTPKQNPEISNLDKTLVNPIARPDIFISRISPKNIAINPDPNFTDKNGKKFLDSNGKPQAVETNSPISLQIEPFWKKDPALERKILIDYFDRNNKFRKGHDSNLPNRYSVISYGSGLSTNALSDILSKASTSFTSPIIKANASLLDYVNWLKSSATLKGISAHSNPWNSTFGIDYNSTALENASGGKPWRWYNVPGTNKYIPSLVEQNGVADLYIHRTIWENKVLKDSGQNLFINNGCEVNSPGDANILPYNSNGYGTFQNAEGILFYLNGLALLSRAKGFYDSPTGFGEAIKQERARFGDGWKEYFTKESNNTDVVSKPADNKRCYAWSIIGDWTLRKSYKNGMGTIGIEADTYVQSLSTANNAWMGSWNFDSNSNTIENSGDFDGDGNDELLITSSWGIGILKAKGNNFTTLMAKPKDTWFGGWRYNASVNTGVDKIQGIGDFDGDGKKEVLVTSSWGIGILKLSSQSMTSIVCKPNDTWFDGWRLNTEDNKIAGIGDFNGDGKDDILITSPWGMGILTKNNDSLTSIVCKANDSWFGNWRLNTKDNTFKGIGDFNGDNIDDILVTSPWGLGLLTKSGSSLNSIVYKANDTWFGNWRLNTKDNIIEGVSDFNGDNKSEILISSPWGIGILKLSSNTLTSVMAEPKDTWFGTWRYNASVNTGKDKICGFGDFNKDGRSDIVISSSWGIGILTSTGTTMTSLVAKPYNTKISSWNLNKNNQIRVFGDFDGNKKCEFIIVN